LWAAFVTLFLIDRFAIWPAASLFSF
jgi:hypothetical protein